MITDILYYIDVTLPTLLRSLSSWHIVALSISTYFPEAFVTPHSLPSPPRTLLFLTPLIHHHVPDF
jgi:hypothetical protein